MLPHEILGNLALCYGSEKLYFNPLFKHIKYTEGIKLMYELCESQWLLIDVLANCTLLEKVHPFILIKVMKEKDKSNCYIKYEDGNGNEIKIDEYRYTDFPLHNTVITNEQGTKKYPALTLYCQNSTLLLPSEN